jgi:Amt family ammonium transporter
MDDALDLTAEHAIGGVIGLLANGFFGTNAVIALDGVNTSIQGGFLDSNWKQLYIQFAYVCATVGYSFVVTAIITKSIDMIPGLHLRTTEEGESLGMDDVEVSFESSLSSRARLKLSIDRRVRKRLRRSTP